MNRKTVGVLGLVLLLAGVAGWRFLASPTRVIRHKAVERRAIALRVLGEFLAEKFAGQEVLIVGNPFTQSAGQPSEVHAFEAAGEHGLKLGCGDKLRIKGVAYPALKPGARENPESLLVGRPTTTPLSFLTADAAWDDLRQANPNTRVWVSLIGLPANLRDLAVWQRPEPHFAFLLPDLRLLGEPSVVLEAFRAGKLAAVVLERPGAPLESAPLARDYHAEFDQRYLLVTARNAADLLRLLPPGY